MKTKERYDLVVIGGGVGGLSVEIAGDIYGQPSDSTGFISSLVVKIARTVRENSNVA